LTGLKNQTGGCTKASTRGQRWRAGINEQQFSDEAVTIAARNICDNLINARLLKADTDERDNEYIQPAHEALLRSWPRLNDSLKAKDGPGGMPKSKK